jgi:mRNA interferase RelE/StbE
VVYKIFVAPTAQEMIKKLRTVIQEKIKYRIGELSGDPEKRGKPLQGELAGFMSVHAAGRYRIIYHVDREQVVLIIVGAGVRMEGDKRDIYTLTRKLLYSGLPAYLSWKITTGRKFILEKS